MQDIFCEFANCLELLSLTLPNSTGTTSMCVLVKCCCCCCYCCCCCCCVCPPSRSYCKAVASAPLCHAKSWQYVGRIEDKMDAQFKAQYQQFQEWMSMLQQKELQASLPSRYRVSLAMCPSACGGIHAQNVSLVHMRLISLDTLCYSSMLLTRAL